MENQTQAPPANLAKIEELLRAKDDTQRFVGLALLKSVLDNSPEIRQEPDILKFLWSCVSSKFLDRLLKTGSSSSNPDAKEMLALAVAILHTFSILLVADEKAQSKLIDRIPKLVPAILYSSNETTDLALQLLYTLVNTKEGTEMFEDVEDLSPLTEIAPSHSLVLDILCRSWLTSMTFTSNKPALRQKIDNVIQSLTVSFRGTDSVTFLEFLGTFLRQADPEIIPVNPKWLKSTATYIQNLIQNRPAAAARSAYTNASATLLQVYPAEMTPLLFTDDVKKDDKPLAYLFINLLLIDIRSSAPVLLEQLNNPDYPATSQRLASAFDTICIFIGYLVQSLEDESLESLVMAPDSLLKLRKQISDTMSVTIEYLRDRWDATFAGAMGLHPDARSAPAETDAGSHLTLTWDSMKDIANRDPFVLSALRALALWLREDENDQLRKEATGLTDVFLDLYKASSAAEGLDFRSPALVALEPLMTFEQGREIFLRQNGWATLSKHLISMLHSHEEIHSHTSAILIIDLIRVLITIAEEEKSGTVEEWLDMITGVAAWDIQGTTTVSATVKESHVGVLQLCCTLLSRATTGMRLRYKHSISAVAGIADVVSKDISAKNDLYEQMKDVLETLEQLR